jgi:hypothetical protein
MSFISEFNQKKIENPAKKFLSWSGSEGKFSYWDKEKKEKIYLDNIQIIILQRMSTITGYSNTHEAGIYSNEVVSTVDSPLNVRTFTGVEIANGLYKDLKEKIKSEGGKYTISCYACIVDDNKKANQALELVNVQFSGASLSPFIEQKISVRDYFLWTISKNPEQQKNGAIKYWIPSFACEYAGDLLDGCEPMTKELEEYLTEYFSKKSNTPTLGEVDTDGVVFELEDTPDISQDDLDDIQMPF